MNSRLAVAYVRAIAGGTIEPQLSVIKRFALEANIQIGKVFVDSGADDDRTGLEEALEWLRAGKASELIVWRLDQVDSKFSDLDSLLTFINELTAIEVTFVSVLDQLDSSERSSKFIANLIPALKPFKARLKGERVHRSLNTAKLEGRQVGRPKQRDDAKILALRKKGQSIRQIASELGVSAWAVQSALKTKEL
ncbi:MAG: recombinase family protein, partial [Bdellovibrionota bacterium]